jgi:hypothetical protein
LANSSIAHENTAAKTAAVGSALEAVAGLGAMALAIIGLVSFFPALFAPISAIVVGVALLLEGAAISVRYSRLVQGPTEHRRDIELSGGLSAEFVGGVAGIALGILSLIGLDAAVLLPVAAIVFGGALMVGSFANARLNKMLVLLPPSAETEGATRFAKESVTAASGAEFLMGSGSVVLGIIALSLLPATAWLALSLVAFLAVGTAVLLTGTAVSGKLLNFLRH